MGLFSGAGLPVKGNINILDNAMFLTFFLVPFIFQERSIKTNLNEFGVDELDCPAQSSTHSKTFVMHWTEIAS